MLVVETGGSGGAHAYWRLTRPLLGRALEALNATLARRLEGASPCATGDG